VEQLLGLLPSAAVRADRSMEQDGGRWLTYPELTAVRDGASGMERLSAATIDAAEAPAAVALIML
jgi:hypothetical protein